MKTILIAGSLAAFLAAGCATQEGASMKAVGAADTPVINVKNNQRTEYVVGSRLARETRESSESVKSISRKGYKEGRDEKPGSPLGGGG